MSNHLYLTNDFSVQYFSNDQGGVLFPATDIWGEFLADGSFAYPWAGPWEWQSGTIGYYYAKAKLTWIGVTGGDPSINPNGVVLGANFLLSYYDNHQNLKYKQEQMRVYCTRAGTAAGYAWVDGQLIARRSIGCSRLW